MNATGRLVVVAVLMFLLDLPWLSFIGGDYNAVVQAIQGGREVRMRPIGAVVVYPALAYLALRTQSLKDAFLTGLAVYAVYDFTVFSVFKDYKLFLAISDTIWGGLLFTAVYAIRQRFGL